MPNRTKREGELLLALTQSELRCNWTSDPQRMRRSTLAVILAATTPILWTSLKWPEPRPGRRFRFGPGPEVVIIGLDPSNFLKRYVILR